MEATRDKSRGKVYQLSCYEAGTLTMVEQYNDKEAARAAYKARFLATGVSPRLSIDGRRIPIYEADAEMGIVPKGWSQNRKPVQKQDPHRLRGKGCDD